MGVGSHFGWKIGQLEKLPEQFVNVPILLGRSFDKAAAGEAIAQVVELFRRHRPISPIVDYSLKMAAIHMIE